MDPLLAEREADTLRLFEEKEAEAMLEGFEGADAVNRAVILIGDDLPPLADAFKTDAFRVRGCQSQVWLVPELRAGRLHLRGDSDGRITRGLVALLIRALDDLPPAVVAGAEFGFLKEIGLADHLSPTRRNGLAAMMTRLKTYAQALAG